MKAVRINTTQKVTPMIYAYTTPEIQRHNGWTKIGYTEKKVEDRIREQTHTADVAWNLEWKGNALFDDGSYEKFTDKDFHAYLRKQGVEQEQGKNNEWFHITGSESRTRFYDFKADHGILSALNTQSINSMMQYIAEYELNVDLSEEYYCSDMAEIHKELLREAIADSRNKAELIASFTGQKIKGIKNVITNYAEYERELLRKRDQELGIHKIGETHIARADRISTPTTDQEETVEVIWLIED